MHDEHRESLVMCPSCSAHRDVDADGVCDNCGAPLEAQRYAPSVGEAKLSDSLLARLARGTRGSLLAGALFGFAAGGLVACSDDGGGAKDSTVQKKDSVASDGAAGDGVAADGVAADGPASDTSADSTRDAGVRKDIPPVMPYGIPPIIVEALA